ncbi:MAG: cyclase family protein [Calditrichaeota bacterium]|nr:cyclase family protein [Calditrichota bacterium]
MRVYDCSVPLHERMVIYPGDPPFRCELLSDVSQGETSTVHQLLLGTHTGTHVDAPAHLFPHAPTIDLLPVETWLGQARVVAVPAQVCVTAADLRHLDLNGCTRLFIRTANSLLWASHKHFFVKDHVYLDAEAADYLAEQGLLLVGFDYLSVDQYGDPTLPAHRRLLGRGIPIVESLDLSQVRPGDYQLVCAPLALTNTEAAPARVFLLEE